MKGVSITLGNHAHVHFFQCTSGLLDLPDHVVEMILGYLCCDAPTNRRNRDVRNFAACCPRLRRIVYGSFVPDYLELGISPLGSSKDIEVYSKFLDQLNWNIKKLRLVFSVNSALMVFKSREEFYCTQGAQEKRIDISVPSLPLIKKLDVEELTLDFSEFYGSEKFSNQVIQLQDERALIEIGKFLFTSSYFLGSTQMIQKQTL